MSFYREECDIVEGWDEVRDSSHTETMFDCVCHTPTCGWNVLLVVAKGDDGWCRASVFEVVEFGEEVLTACHVMC